MNTPMLVIPTLTQANLTPVEVPPAGWVAINDELGGMILDELGLPICEE